MSPAIRLGSRSEDSAWERKAPIERTARLHRGKPELGGIKTRSIEARGEGTATLLLHGWCDSADTWLAVLERISRRGGSAIAYDLPGFGVAPPLGEESVLDQLVDFSAAAVLELAERSGGEVIVAGNSLGGWTALRLAQREDLPIKAVIPIAPAGVQMAPAFFAIDRIPAVAQIVGLPAPTPRVVTRAVVGRIFRQLAFSHPSEADAAVVDRFTRFNSDRKTLRRRLETAKALREDLDDPFDHEAIEIPVTVIWGDRDRLCLPEGASKLCGLLPHADLHVINDCGHMPQHEVPQLVVEVIEGLR
jgi:pimeloyl-ACP methyl ester carboxylesterase